MKIGIISDTHGDISAWRKAMELFDGADLIIHAGDVLYHPPKLCCSPAYNIPEFASALNSSEIPIVIAQGNCDSQVYEELLKVPSQIPYAHVLADGIRIIANHGHLLSRDQMVELGRKWKADYFISGHTHVPVIEDAGGVVLMNPGSPALPKFEIDGKAVATVGIITEKGARIVSLEDGSIVMELEATK